MTLKLAGGLRSLFLVKRATSAGLLKLNPVLSGTPGTLRSTAQKVLTQDLFLHKHPSVDLYYLLIHCQQFLDSIPMARGRLTRCLSLVFAVLLFSNLGYACITVESILKKQYKRHYLFCRRGAPGEMVTAYYKEYLHNLIKFVETIAPRSPKMGMVCMNSTEVGQFAALYDHGAVDKMIENMYSVDPQMFYLPESQYSDSDLLPMSRSRSHNVDLTWDNTERQLQLPTSQVNLDSMKKIPGGVQFIYDPARSTVCKKLNERIEGILKTMNAVELSYKVTAIVIRLKLLGVPDRNSMQILKHHAAFTFNAIRCQRKNMFELEVSGVFLPWYEAAFTRLTEGIDVNVVPEIPTSVLEARFPKTVPVLAHFRGWGQLHFLRFDEKTMTVQNTHISEILFNPRALKEIKSELGILTATLAEKERIMSAVTWQHSTAIIASRLSKCNSGYFSFNAPPAMCCPVICKNTHALKTIKGDFTTSSCCRATKNGVSFFSAEFKKLSTIQLEPYGYSQSKIVPLMV